MKRRFLPLLLSLGLLFSLLPAVSAEEEPQTVTALCVAEPGSPAFLDEDEFQLLCRQATGRDLKSVTFDRLAPSVGTLTCKGEAVTPEVACYMYEKPLLSQVCFTPYTYGSRRFTGQAELSFTMTDEKGKTVPGTLVLYVPEEEAEPPAENPFMDKAVSRSAGQPVPLIDLLPEWAWYKSRSPGGSGTYASDGTGWYYIREDLTSAVFTLPPSNQGYLWLSYDWSSARKLLPGEVLYPDQEPNFYDVTFVPADGEGRTVSLTYTVSCESRSEVPANLTLTLTGEEPSAPSSSPSKPAPVEAAPATISTSTAQVGLATVLDRACDSRKLGSLETVVFDTLPTPQEGTILSADVPVAPGTPYPYSTLAFLPGDSFQGGLTLRYVGTDSMGLSFSGTLTLALDYPAGGRFQDLAGWEWATYAARFLDMQRAVPYSKSDPSFRPGDPATRMELVYALVQVGYPTAERVAAPGFSGLPADPDLANAATVAIAHGLLQGDEEKRLFLDSQVTRQDALVMIHRALTNLGGDLPPAGDLSPFSDAGDLSSYAREAAAVLCAKGILQGNGAGKLNPLSPITRAEMACLLYRAFGG